MEVKGQYTCNIGNMQWDRRVRVVTFDDAFIAYVPVPGCNADNSFFQARAPANVVAADMYTLTFRVLKHATDDVRDFLGMIWYDPAIFDRASLEYRLERNCLVIRLARLQPAPVIYL